VKEEENSKGEEQDTIQWGVNTWFRKKVIK
jgi:hypothetical protein